MSDTPIDIENIKQQAALLIQQISVARDNGTRRRAAVTFMVACDAMLTSPLRIGALLSAYVSELTNAGIDHKKIISLVSGESITPKQRRYVKTMAIVLTSVNTPAGREQIRKNGINYQELENVIGSDRFGGLKIFLSGE